MAQNCGQLSPARILTIFRRDYRKLISKQTKYATVFESITSKFHRITMKQGRSTNFYRNIESHDMTHGCHLVKHTKVRKISTNSNSHKSDMLVQK